MSVLRERPWASALATMRRLGMLKIYLLMALIGTIAAMSHLNSKRGSPERGT